MKRVVKFNEPRDMVVRGALHIRGTRHVVELCLKGIRYYFSIPKDAENIRMILSTKKENNECMKLDLKYEVDEWMGIKWDTIRCTLDGRFKPYLLSNNASAVLQVVDAGFKYVYFDYMER